MPSYLSSANPATTSASSYDGYGCLVSFNLVARVHNACLRRAVGELRRSYPRAMVAYADYFAAYLDILGDPSRFGFEGGAAPLSACCGAGGAYNFVSGRLCGAPGTSVCADPGGRVSWDGIHMTQHAYGVMAELLYRGGLACPVPVKLPRQKDCPPRQ
jgi:phospholipase/lecithinase/hemolysin